MAGPDIKNIAALADPIPAAEIPAPEPDTKNLDALLASLNGSAERFQTLWFSFLGLTLYLAIAALATTHRNLLLGEPQVLPILNIKVELLPFYVIAPLLYLVFHFYVLMMLVLLARTGGEFDKQLRTTLPGEPERERYRAQVGNALFLQLLVGMKGERAGVNAFLMGLIALITIVLAPLATLVLMQMMFLPYHHLRITWWHRGIVVADLVLIVVMTYRCFFPRGVRKAPLVLGALSRKPRWATAMAFCVLLAVGLFLVTCWLSFQQGRWAGEPSPSSFTQWTQWMEGTPATLPDVNPDYAATEDGVVFHLFPDRLKLPDETIVGKERWEKTKEEIASRKGAKETPDEADFVPTIKLDGRDLQASNLYGVDLRGVSLNGAALQGANLSKTRLDVARLSCAGKGDARICAQLRGANLSDARLQGALISSAQLQGADLGNAELQRARLGNVNLQQANLEGAQLQGAYLFQAHLQGADLTIAQLQGADLTIAQLQGADLSHAKLHGAVLAVAGLQGADLSGAEAQGANLKHAQLQGARLSEAQLQGADLSGADLSDSAFDGTFVFRTSASDSDMATLSIRSLRPNAEFRDADGATQPLTPVEVDAWIAAGTEFAPETDKAALVRRFSRLKVDFQEDATEPKWSGLAEVSLALDPDGSQSRRRQESRLGDLVCDANGAPYVARGLTRNGRLEALGDQLDGVRKRMKEGRDKPEKCPGVAGFTERDWHRLDALEPD